ncbi:DUF1998 domain-containing protein [Kitasatospora kazusensis]|uniref:DUF1998 domain-containing protein n=1 Tax=Kitasatospora kazusensis TaxID=407974 RepID=A0ABN2YVZ9_9ACTN
MSRNLRVRQAQTVLPFGVGAILDIQGESFVAAGIGDWPAAKIRRQILAPRLVQKLPRVTALWAPPPAPVAEYDVPDARGPAYIRFPSWLFCGSCRRMVRWRIGEERFGRPPVCGSCQPQRKLAPMRFVQICAQGHLGDVDWWYWAHSQLTAPERERCPDRARLRFRVEESSTGLEALSVSCRNEECEDASRDLLDIQGTKALRCTGRNPWQYRSESADCPETVQIVQRTAGNLYYPVVHSALDIPVPAAPVVLDSDTAARVRTHAFWTALCQALDAPSARNLFDLIAESVGADEALMQALLEEETGRRLGEPAPNPAGTGPTGGPDGDPPFYPDLSWEEWTAFTQPVPESSQEFSIRRVGLGIEPDDAMPWHALDAGIAEVVIADRLREVRALQGFTRVSPSEAIVPVDTRVGARQAHWLPAIEVFGEGVFLSFHEDSLTQWEADAQVQHRVTGMADDLSRSFQRDRLASVTGELLLPRFPLLHTFAHLLIRQLAFESGYSTASLRERVYARPAPAAEPGPSQSGILIYTASGDADGTMGGLARQGEPGLLAETIIRLLEQAAWCSADPLCAEHLGQGFANLNRAACHACALLPETSCETGNSLLDRMLVVGGTGVPGYFEAAISAARVEAAQISQESGLAEAPAP